jgi:hypothetical protein
MPSRAESRQWAAIFATWNRKLHYYLGLYFLFFIWLFALSGLLLNHGGWTFAQFYPNRKVSTLERAIDTPASTSDLELARLVMRQVGIEGEIAWTGPRSSPARLEFNASRPGRVYQVQADLVHARARITLTQYNGWGIVRTLHTFVGVSPEDPRNQRDWLLTSVWALSMDAVAAGIILMVLSSLYMWWGLKEKRLLGIAALALGTLTCGLFVTGLRWLYG